MKLTTSAVLAVNHVYEILVEQYNLKDWAKTLAKVIPERKIQSEENVEKMRLKTEKKQAIKEHFNKLKEQREQEKINNSEGEVVLRVNTKYEYPDGTSSDHLPFGQSATGYAG